MIKGFGYFSLFVFLILCSQIGGFSMGLTVWALSFLLVCSGTFAFACLQFPRELENGVITRLFHYGEKDYKPLLIAFEELSLTVRKEGLFAIENTRKDLKDPFLRYLLKRVIGGFDKNQINALVRNQFLRSQELFAIMQSFFDRVAMSISVIGLIGSLFQIMDYLNHNAGSLSVVFIPFVLSLILQLLLQSFFLERFFRALDNARLYHFLLEEGMHGIQDGINSELLRDKMSARVNENIKWAEG